MKPFVFVAASFAVLLGMAFLGTGSAEATTIPATISTTLTITTDSHLTSDVACTVTGAPCIKFGAPGIALKLNGFIITGNGGRNTCALNNAESGIDTNTENNVSIRGPGLVRRFNGFASIIVTGNHSSVEGVAITSSCGDGILVNGNHNELEGNSVSRVSLASNSEFEGIFLAGPAGHSVIRHNEVVGASQGGSGINVESSNNLIEENDASGNPVGFGISVATFATGNTFRHNQALGNGPGADILDANALPANTYDNNLCEVSLIVPSGVVNICKVPNIAGHSNFRPDRD